MGHQPNRWFCYGFCHEKHSSLVRQKVLCRCDSETHRTLWPGSKRVWLRPRWAQFIEYQEGESIGCKTRGYRSCWTGQVERVSEDVGENQMRTRASRRCHWKSEIKKIRIQQTKRQINIGNDYVGTPLVLGVQPVQDFAVIEPVRSFSGVVKNELHESNNKRRVFHRKVIYPQ